MSEIGVIGQIYEDRRTKKRGKLLERDEKFKTLLLESDDGKSFNITFGGFKSNWRKVDEPIQTVEEAMEEVIPEEKITVDTKVKKITKKKSKSKTVKKFNGEISEALEEATKILVEYISSYNSALLQIKPQFDRDYIAIKMGDRKFIEVFRRKRTNHYIIACKEDVAKFVKDFKFVYNLKYYPTRKPLNYAFYVDADNFDKFLESFRSIIVDMLSDNVKGE